MNLVEAEEKTRFYASDLKAKNWSAARVFLAIETGINKLRQFTRGTDPRLFRDLIHVAAADWSGTVKTLKTWNIPTKVDEVEGVYLDEELKNRLSHRGQIAPGALDSGWEIRPGYRRQLTVPNSVVEAWIAHYPIIPKLNGGTMTVLLDTATLTVVTGALSNYENSYRGWAFEILSGAHAGFVFEPVSSAGDTITADDTLPPIALNTPYTMRLPWPEQLNEAICIKAAQVILQAEGHRRGLATLEPVFNEALDALATWGIFTNSGAAYVHDTYHDGEG